MLAMAAMLLRCAIAPGFMLDPMAVAQGEVKLVICTSAGVKSTPAMPGRGSAPRHQSGDGLCPFATPAHAGIPADLFVLGGERLRPAFEPPARDAESRSAQIRSFSARAPPRLS